MLSWLGCERTNRDGAPRRWSRDARHGARNACGVAPNPSTWRPGASSSTCHRLEPHLDAVVLVGAQAVYLRTEDESRATSLTTDADLVVDRPARTDTAPRRAMTRAGFTLSDEPGNLGGRASTDRASRGSRRARRPHRPGGVGSEGGAASCPSSGQPRQDHCSQEFRPRRCGCRQLPIQLAAVRVEGCATGARQGRRPRRAPGRKAAQARGPARHASAAASKDAGDVYRLFDRSPPTTWRRLFRCSSPMNGRDDDNQGAHIPDALFTAPASPGVGLACEALRTLLPRKP